MASSKRINGKVIHEVAHWKELLTMGDPTVQMPDCVTPEAPLELFIGQPVLEAILEDNIAAVHNNRAELDRDGEREQTDAMLLVREEFLAWVRAHPGINIFMSIHPVDEFPELADGTT